MFGLHLYSFFVAYDPLREWTSRLCLGCTVLQDLLDKSRLRVTLAVLWCDHACLNSMHTTIVSFFSYMR
jgi:hypothetical protein